MSGDIDNLRQWLGADALVAPVGSTAPTDIVTAWDVAWDTLGVLSESAGATEMRGATTNEYYGWGIGLARVTFSKEKFSFKITASEDNAVVSSLVNFGAPATSTGGVTTRPLKGGGTDVRAFALERTDGTVTKRLIVPKAQVTTVTDIASSEEKVTEYELTIEAYKVSIAGGSYFGVEITDDPGAVVA